MYVKLITPSTTEPFTIEEIKLYLRVEGNEEDSLIGDLIKNAREYAENFTNRVIMPATYEAVLSYSDYQRLYVDIPTSPIIELQTIKYFDGTEVEQNFLIDNDFNLDSYREPYRIKFINSITESTKLYPVRITFIAGYEIGKIPGNIKMAMRYLIAKWYEYREDFTVKNGFSEVDKMLWHGRVVPI